MHTSTDITQLVALATLAYKLGARIARTNLLNFCVCHTNVKLMYGYVSHTADTSLRRTYSDK